MLPRSVIISWDQETSLASLPEYLGLHSNAFVSGYLIKISSIIFIKYKLDILYTEIIYTWTLFLNIDINYTE
jgi:hypothetical protein